MNKRPQQQTPLKLVLRGALAALIAPRKPTKQLIAVGAIATSGAVWGILGTVDAPIYAAIALVAATSVYLTHLEAVRARAESPAPDVRWIYLGGVVTAVPTAYLAPLVLSAVALFGMVAAGFWLLFKFLTRQKTTTKPLSRGKNSHFNADGTAKLEYRNEAAATFAASEYQRDFGSTMNVYPCADGDHFHIGHQKKTK